MTRTATGSVAAVFATALLLAPLAGCGGDEGKPTAAESASVAPTVKVFEPTNGSAGLMDKEAISTFVKVMTAAISDKKSVHMSIEGTTTIHVEGDVQYGTSPAIKLTTTISGQAATSIFVNRVLYLQDRASGKYEKVTMEDPTYGKALGVLEAFDPRSSVRNLESGISKAVKVGTTTVDGRELTQYIVAADPLELVGAMGQMARLMGVSGDLPMAFYLDSDGLVHQIAVNVADQKIRMKFTDWGKPVDIKAPTSAQLAPSVQS